MCRASRPACLRPEFHGHIRLSATGPVALQGKIKFAHPDPHHSSRCKLREERDDGKARPRECVGRAALLAFSGSEFHGHIRLSATEPVALQGRIKFAHPDPHHSSWCKLHEGKARPSECVGRAALLAFGQSLTVTSGFRQPSQSPYRRKLSLPIPIPTILRGANCSKKGMKD